jgi:hypothetical protein
MESKSSKRKTVPKSNENQNLKQRKCLNKLRMGALKPSLTTHIIEDDESYFIIDGSNNCGSDSYFSHPSLEVAVKLSINLKRKIQIKFLFGFAINSNTYINECIKKRLIKFIEKYHSDDNYILCPDLLSSHYPIKTISSFEELGINYVKREENSPNVPQLRNIEKFWVHLKRNVYSEGRTADQLSN